MALEAQATVPSTSDQRMVDDMLAILDRDLATIVTRSSSPLATLREAGFGQLADALSPLVVQAGELSPGRPRRPWGRPSVMTPEKLSAAREMLRDPTRTVEQVATALGVGRTTLYTWLRATSPRARG